MDVDGQAPAGKVANSMDNLVRWTAAGGRVTGSKKKQVFVAPDGAEFTSWAGAEQWLTTVQEGAEGGRPGAGTKRSADAGKENPSKKPKAAKPAVNGAVSKPEASTTSAPAAAAVSPAKVARGKGAKRPRKSDGALSDSTNAAEDAIVGSGRQAAQNAVYKEQRVSGNGANARLKVKTEETAESEREALDAVDAGSASLLRRLSDFSVVDAAGEVQRLSGAGDAGSEQLYLAGVIHPLRGPMDKEVGRRVSRFGPLVSWTLDLGAKQPLVRVKTQAAEYHLVKPAAAYREVFGHMLEQCDIACQVYQALCPAVGGRYDVSPAEVVARMARAKVGKSYGSPREALLLSAKFVTARLLAAGDGAASFAPFISSLAAEADAYARQSTHGPMTIREPSAGGSSGAPGAGGASMEPSGAEPMEADEDFARQLQAKLDAADARRQSNGARRGAAVGAYVVKVHESEIADDYPPPASYQRADEEADELLLFDEDGAAGLAPEDLPRRALANFALYNSEGMLASLELLPMWSGVDPDVELFASGDVAEEDDEWAGGHSLDGGSNAATNAGAEGGSSGTSGGEAKAPGMRLYLSQIREWMVEISADTLFISMRTDVAWYRLTTPMEKYAPWFETVLKAARMAVCILQMLANEARASKLSFTDVVKRLAAQPDTAPTFIAKQDAKVERFVVVHGQIILNQFRHYPSKAVQASAFATALKAAMESRRHSKLYMGSAKAKHAVGSNRNPMKDVSGPNRAKPMTATATAQVQAIWQQYFTAAPRAEEAAVADADAAAGGQAKEVQEDDNEEDDEAAVENALAAPVASPAILPRKKAARKASAAKAAWVGDVASAEGGLKSYRGVEVAGVAFAVGDVVMLHPADGASAVDNDATADGPLGLLQALWQTSTGAKEAQVRRMLPGAETVLGDAAAPDELFLSDAFETRPVADLLAVVGAECLVRRWDVSRRLAHAEEDKTRQARNEVARAEGRPQELIYRKLYLPEQGMFADLPADLRLGIKQSEKVAVAMGISISADGKGWTRDGTAFEVGDFVFVTPDTFSVTAAAAKVDTEPVPGYAAKGGYVKGGSNSGLRAWGIARVVEVPKPKKGAAAGEAKAVLLRFWRPEEVSRDVAYTAAFSEVYASDDKHTVELAQVIGKCSVLPAGSDLPDVDSFQCTGTFKVKTGKVSAPPKEFAAAKGQQSNGQAATGGAAHPQRETFGLNDGVALRTLDVFAGCGGLSEGLNQARAAVTKWAIEYEVPAAEAFRLNHPGAATFTENCNVILARAMANGGLQADCRASPEALELADKMEHADELPAPGQVDFIVGGPPCQGYSGMNRFNKGNWSMVQNSMVMSYLSYADFYRPRYFLLENVRNFVSHNKSFTFRLTLRTLLDLGYQVRFGVLNAGNFGVSQSRKRTFIWGAAPGEALPDWPKLMHVFRSPQLTIRLPGGVTYTAVPQTVGAPLRTVTVRDTIGDLPPVENGADRDEMPYGGPSVSEFQRRTRGGQDVLLDHVCKTMTELNLERCKCIPVNMPGADWRALQELVAEDPSRELFKGQPLVPWCLPNTADRHNGWRGLYGRLDWGGHFPTSTTDPQPMGKVGQVLHPDQHRIVSVRECARSQGFPDSFRFYGTVNNKHRQIGNAVPPPLALALGRELRKVLEATAAAEAKAALAAQFED